MYDVSVIWSGKRRATWVISIVWLSISRETIARHKGLLTLLQCRMMDNKEKFICQHAWSDPWQSSWCEMIAKRQLGKPEWQSVHTGGSVSLFASLDGRLHHIRIQRFVKFAMGENFLAQEMVKLATRIVSGRGGAISNEVAAGNKLWQDWSQTRGPKQGSSQKLGRWLERISALPASTHTVSIMNVDSWNWNLASVPEWLRWRDLCHMALSAAQQSRGGVNALLARTWQRLCRMQMNIG